MVKGAGRQACRHSASARRRADKLCLARRVPQSRPKAETPLLACCAPSLETAAAAPRLGPSVSVGPQGAHAAKEAFMHSIDPSLIRYIVSACRRLRQLTSRQQRCGRRQKDRGYGRPSHPCRWRLTPRLSGRRAASPATGPLRIQRAIGPAALRTQRPIRRRPPPERLAHPLLSAIVVTAAARRMRTSQDAGGAVVAPAEGVGAKAPDAVDKRLCSEQEAPAHDHQRPWRRCT
jgi:hypothetical protein